MRSIRAAPVLMKARSTTLSLAILVARSARPSPFDRLSFSQCPTNAPRGYGPRDTCRGRQQSPCALLHPSVEQFRAAFVVSSNGCSSCRPLSCLLCLSVRSEIDERPNTIRWPLEGSLGADGYWVYLFWLFRVGRGIDLWHFVHHA